MPHAHAIWLAQPDERLRTQLAVGLRGDGMQVVEFGSPEAALEALREGGKAAVLVTTPAEGRLTERELAEQARLAAPRIEVILTPSAPRPDSTPSAGFHVLSRPLDPFRLSRFIRLVAAKPALRGVLQAQYRSARSEDPIAVPVAS
ncbi:MAG: hypothetical protein ACXWVJ_07215 [Caulobacteraceae bacterium]